MKNTRQKLLASATKMFAQNGYNGASIRAITKDANVNLSMVSYYFGSKEGLYIEMIESYLDKISQTIDTLKNDESMGALARLKAYYYDVSELFAKNQYFVTLFMMEINNPTPSGEKIKDKYFMKFKNFIIDTIETGVRNGELRSDVDINNIAFFFIGMMNFYNVLYSHLSTKKSVPIVHHLSKHYLDDAFLMLVGGIQA